MDGVTQGRPVGGILRDLVKVYCKETSQVALGGGAVQGCTVEFSVCSCCPGLTGLNVHAELGSDHTVISPALCSTHDSGGKYVPSVLLADNNVIQEMPVL